MYSKGVRGGEYTVGKEIISIDLSRLIGAGDYGSERVIDREEKQQKKEARKYEEGDKLH